METAQLSYFILACQFRNHAEAATWAQVAPSTLSENLHALERELGLTLFQRGPQGHYPTEAARWLYQTVEPLLQAVDIAQRVVAQPDLPSLRYLDVTSPLQFMAGHLARTTSLAIRALMHSMPGVVAHARFALSRPPYVHALDQRDSQSADVCGAAKSGVVLNYAANADEPDGVVILRDEWISLAGMAMGKHPGDSIITFAALSSAPLYVPPLDDTQLTQIRHYCHLHDLPQPRVIEEDVGTFERLSREQQPFHLLAPRSLVAASAERSTLRPQRLPVELAAVIVAHFAPGDQVAAGFVAHLRAIIRGDNPVVAWKPTITCKQLRYFLTVARWLNVTAAARQLHVAQPALSSQISKLETALGTPLFQRSRKGLIPLHSARLLSDLIRPAMQACEGIAAAASYYAANREERLTIGITPVSDHDGALAQGIALAIAEWTRRYPSVKLRVVEGTAETLRSRVGTGDVRFAMVDSAEQGDLAIMEPLGVISCAQRPMIKPGNITLHEALQLPLVLPGAEVRLRQQLNRAAAAIAASVSPAIEVSSLTLILSLVKQMPLAAIMPASAVTRLVADGILQFNAICEPHITQSMSILCPDNQGLTHMERELIALLGEHIQAEPDKNRESLSRT
jgi:DNA-binding transcriptional LysR family regulator